MHTRSRNESLSINKVLGGDVISDVRNHTSKEQKKIDQQVLELMVEDP